MSKEVSPIDWSKMWTEYDKALKAWMSIFDTFQEATKSVQKMYNDLMAHALKGSDTYPMMSQFADNWQKSMSGVGFNPFKQFDENWQNLFNQPAMEQFKAYGDMLKKFSEAYCWYEMWKK